MPSNDILHITPEIGQHVLGGIGTICNEIYNNTNSNIKFEYIVRELNCDIVIENDRIKTILKENIGVDSHYDHYSTIVFHDYFIFAIYYQNNNFKLRGNEWVVIHSNAIMERVFTERYFDNQRVFWFTNVMEIPNIKLIVVSQSEKKILQQQFPFINSNNINVIYNGIDFNNHFKYNNKSTNCFGYIGRLDERKGIIKLIYDFKNTLPNETLYLATGGYGKYMHEMEEKLVAALPYLENIIPVGWCQGTRKINFFKSIDALIVPSYYEPFGVMILEAFFYGMPVITTRVGGITEILGDDYPFYVDMVDKFGLANIIKLFKSYSQKQLNDLVQKHQNDIMIRFNVNNMINQYNNLNIF